MSPRITPAWIRKRDGRLVAFDADKIGQALFAASESLGSPDAFLTRELADSVLHFLGEELSEETPSTQALAELIVKVVRELGHAPLAQAFRDGAARKQLRRVQRTEHTFALSCATHGEPEPFVRAALRQFSLHAVFTRDIVAAQQDGLLSLYCLDTPASLAASVLAPGAAAELLLPALAEARTVTGRLVVLDGLDAADRPAEQLSRLQLGLRLTGLHGVLHLDAPPPPWADAPVGGPLFPTAAVPQAETDPAHRTAAILAQRAPELQLDWHLTEHSCDAAALAALTQPRLAFVFPRAGRPVPLGPGLDRKHTALLLAVGLHLPRLAELPGVASDPELFLSKLTSLAHLALSAAAQKRAYLRQLSQGTDARAVALQRGFLLARARLLVLPIGLAWTVRRLLGGAICSSKLALEYACRVVVRLREALHAGGQRSNLPTCLGGHADLVCAPEQPLDAQQAPDLTAWDAEQPLEAQLRAAGALHRAADQGTATLLLPAAGGPTVEEMAALLRFALRETEVSRLRVQRVPG